MNIGERIYKLRTERNLSQEELSNLLEVSRQSVSKWETNTSVPDLDKLIKLCDVFEITLDELTGRTSAFAPVSQDAAYTLPEPIVPTSAALSPKNGITLRQLVGLVLLTFSLLGFILTGIFLNFALATLLMLPLAVCSIACLALKTVTPWSVAGFVFTGLSCATGLFCYGLPIALLIFPLLLLCGCICFIAQKRPLFFLVWTVLGLLELWLSVGTYFVSAKEITYLIERSLRIIYTASSGILLQLFLALFFGALMTVFASFCFQKEPPHAKKCHMPLLIAGWLGYLVAFFLVTVFYRMFLHSFFTVASIFLYCLLFAVKNGLLLAVSVYTARFFRERKPVRPEN